MSDGIDLRVVRDSAVPTEVYPRLCERLARSFLPAPAVLEPVGGRAKKLKGWADPALARAFGEQDAFEVKGEGVRLTFFRRHVGEGIDLAFRLGPDPAALRALFLDLCELIEASYGRVRLINRGREIHEAHYAARRRTFHADGLHWLNFFGPDELARQGGEAVAKNPHAQVERTAGGVVLQIGAAPEDELTAEGEAREVAATRALPELPSHAPAAQQPAPAAGAAGPTGDLRVIAGTRGFFDEATGRFWVPNASAPGSRIDARALEKLAALKGEPGVREVILLFSHEQTARDNAPALGARGLGAFFISTDTGQAQEV